MSYYCSRIILRVLCITIDSIINFSSPNTKCACISDTWGDKFPNSDPDWDLIIASDILLCKIIIVYYLG